MHHSISRRHFLCSAPLAAAALGLTTDVPLLAAETTPEASSVPSKLVSAAQLADAMKTLQTKPGNDTLFEAPALPLTLVLTTETHKSAKEFEYHEGRDHVVQILEGATMYEVGGSPQSAHNTKPGEWLAPRSEGATTFTLAKGDMLVIPRGTPHKRSTAEAVTLLLISTSGAAKP